MPTSNIVVVAFAFSKTGQSNLTIAKRATALAKAWKAPIFTQNDVALHIDPKAEGVVLFTAKQTAGYLSTFGIVRDLKGLSKIAGWTRAIVVAAPSHDGRCIRDLEMMGFDVIQDRDFHLRRHTLKGHWYNPRDPQLWVRNPLIWWMREAILRLMPWGIYRRIAG